jgi:hypothetical protein
MLTAIYFSAFSGNATHTALQWDFSPRGGRARFFMSAIATSQLEGRTSTTAYQ